MQTCCRFKVLFSEPNTFETNKHDFDVRFRETLRDLFSDSDFFNTQCSKPLLFYQVMMNNFRAVICDGRKKQHGLRLLLSETDVRYAL